jgi:ABC-type transport system involved in cytochrome bd biosynthesis fused ATPase/permease subunit
MATHHITKLAHAAQGDATMTPAQMEAEIATFIRQQQQENQKKRLLRWGLGLVVAILIPSLVSVGLMIMGTGEDHPPPMSISLMPLIVILPAIAALVRERKSWLSQ